MASSPVLCRAQLLSAERGKKLGEMRRVRPVERIRTGNFSCRAIVLASLSNMRAMSRLRAFRFGFATNVRERP